MDRTFDRLPEFDERSRQYPARALLSLQSATIPLEQVRSYAWNMREPLWSNPLDQGPDGACVGFGFANEIALPPKPNYALTYDYAFAIYRWAQQHDEWEGEDYDGTSVLAGAKAVTEWLTRYVEYRWCFSLDDLIRTIAYHGPVVLGWNWYTGMMRPDVDGRIRPTGVIEGGHCIVANKHRGYLYGIPSQRRRLYVWQSWGRVDGWPEAWLTWDDAERLMHEQGEACVPVVRA